MFVKENKIDLMSLRLEPLENLFEAVQTRLTHPIQRVGSLDLTEVGRPVAARGIQDICLAVHILDHEVLPLEKQYKFHLNSSWSMTLLQHFPSLHTPAFISICKFCRANMSTLR